MKLIFSALCEDAVVRPDDGRLDVRGVFHDLFAPGFPAKQDHMTLVLVVEWDEEDRGRYRFRAELLDPDDREMGRMEIETDVAPPPPGMPPARTKLVQPMEDSVFVRPGRHRFRVKVKGRTFEGPILHLHEQPEGGGARGPGGGAGGAPGSGDAGGGDGQEA